MRLATRMPKMILPCTENTNYLFYGRDLFTIASHLTLTMTMIVLGLACVLIDKKSNNSNTSRYKVDIILERLPEDEADSLRAALMDPDVLTSKISQVLTDYGHPVSPNAVSNYRRRLAGVKREG